MRKIIFTCAVALSVACAYAQNTATNTDAKIQKTIQAHYDKYKDLEYFSGITVSVSVPQQKINNYYVGYLSRDKNSKKMDKNALFQIGSITKSFTAAIMLQLDKEGSLHLTDKLTTLLPHYHKWDVVTLLSLLNMTSGLPNYSDTPLLNAEETANLARVWTDSQLVDYVYPKDALDPPLMTGYLYSNTGYILASMIIEQVTKDSFQNVITKRMIKPADLDNTFYLIPKMEMKAEQRLANGYYYNQYDNPALVGVDIHDNNLSWAGAAGALVSNSEDVAKWVRALFVGTKILNPAQKNKLTSLVSLETGKPIKEVTEADKQGFGLGVAKTYDKSIGSFWFYEGETLGYRAIYIYIPCNGVIVSGIFNSATNKENDHSKELLLQVYKQVVTSGGQGLVCH